MNTVIGDEATNVALCPKPEDIGVAVARPPTVDGETTGTYIILVEQASHASGNLTVQVTNSECASRLPEPRYVERLAVAV